MMEYSITQKTYEELTEELETASHERCREIARSALSMVTIFGYEDYDAKIGDDKICECGHAYYRHFDTYDDMRPVGCKYCCCNKFTENKQ